MRRRKRWRMLTSMPMAPWRAAQPRKTFAQAAWQIVIADVSMSLDNVLAVAGAARDHPTVLVIGLILSIALMGLAASFIARLLSKHRWIAYVGLAIILYVSLEMIYRGCGGSCAGGQGDDGWLNSGCAAAQAAQRPCSSMADFSTRKAAGFGPVFEAMADVVVFKFADLTAAVADGKTGNTMMVAVIVALAAGHEGVDGFRACGRSLARSAGPARGRPAAGRETRTGAS